MNDLEFNDAKYGILMDEINIKKGFGLEFCITVPEHSELNQKENLKCVAFIWQISSKQMQQ
jgi:hypothetical protein